MNSSVKRDVRPDGVGVLTIDQPGSKANVLTRELWTDLDAALDEAAKQPLKGLVIASAKPGIFIAGADLRLLADATGPNDTNVRSFIEQGLRVLEKLESLPFPTCAAIDGAALGGGLEVALACDCRVLGNNPRIQLGLPEVKLGLIPGWGGTQRLPRVMDWSMAVHLLLTGNATDAKGAVMFGLAIGAGSQELLDACSTQVLANAAGTIAKRRLRAAPIVVTGPTIGPPQVDSLAGFSLARLVEATRTVMQSSGIKLETEAFMNLAGSPESKRLIAEFFASRKK